MVRGLERATGGGVRMAGEARSSYRLVVESLEEANTTIAGHHLSTPWPARYLSVYYPPTREGDTRLIDTIQDDQIKVKQSRGQGWISVIMEK